MASRCSILVVMGALVALVGCAEPLSGSAVGLRPADALRNTLAAAKAADAEAFQRGLSANFVATVKRYQELASAKPELRGAFDWPVFMRSLATSSPSPTEELIKGDKAKVRAVHRDGIEAVTEMVLEEGMWKLEVPDGMVRGLDHFDEIARMAQGEASTPGSAPNLPVGGGGQGGRVKALPDDATEAQRQRAAALDAFDLGDVAGASKQLELAVGSQPEDEELVVALGRAYVQSNRGAEAVKLFEQYLGRHDAAVAVRHYLGMAYMMANEPAKAAAEWKRVMSLDAAYAGRFRLDQRAAAAMAIAAGGAPRAGAAAPTGHAGVPPGPASRPAAP